MNMTVTIIFHSVIGNCFILAKAFAAAFRQFNTQVQLRRVPDEDLISLQRRFSAAEEISEELNAIPLITLEEFCQADFVLLGCPNYFGNVSAEMKTFMDASAAVYLTQPLKGKPAGFFCTSSSINGGGNFCLEAMIRYAQHMAMMPLSVPLSAQMCSPALSAYGVNHIAGLSGECRPDHKLLTAITDLSKFWLSQY